MWKESLKAGCYFAFAFCLLASFTATFVKKQSVKNDTLLYHRQLQTYREDPVAYAAKKSGRKQKKQNEAILSEIQYPPVPVTFFSAISYSDTWGADRTYKENRKKSKHIHEGCDLIYSKNKPGIVPVVSMTDGVVEQMGWLTLGGYRIGIRSGQGIYYYYAHLDSYAENVKKGDTVIAGQLLGFMGNTGYGKEGTKGKFVVHLHLGIYVPDFDNNKYPYAKKEHEISINPYPFLKERIP